MAGHRTELAAYDAMVGLARRLSLDTADAPAADDGSAPVAVGPWRGSPGRCPARLRLVDGGIVDAAEEQVA